jgi:hypothetical protein
MLAQAQVIDRDYKPQLYDLARTYRDLTKPLGARMLNAARLSTATIQVLRELKNFKEGEKQPARWIEQVAANKWSGDPKYARLYQALNQYANAAAAVQGGGNVVRVTLVNNVLRHMSETASPAATRGQMQIDNRDSFATVEQADAAWREQTGKSWHVPNYPGRPAEILNAFSRANAATGQMPEDAPDELKSVSRKPSSGDRPSWRTQGQERAPLTTDQVSKAKEFIERYKDDPDENVKRQVQRLRERVY